MCVSMYMPFTTHVVLTHIATPFFSSNFQSILLNLLFWLGPPNQSLPLKLLIGSKLYNICTQVV